MKPKIHGWKLTIGDTEVSPIEGGEVVFGEENDTRIKPLGLDRITSSAFSSVTTAPDFTVTLKNVFEEVNRMRGLQQDLDFRQLVEVARHEAGHAVVGYTLGIAIKRVWAKSSCGACEIEPIERVIPEPAPGENRQRGTSRVDLGAMLLAGGMAQFGKPKAGCWPLVVGSDLASFEALHLDNEEREQALERAFGILTREWHRVEWVAEALVKRRELDACELAQAIGGAP
jgi:hypothetical protein